MPSLGFRPFALLTIACLPLTAMAAPAAAQTPPGIRACPKPRRETWPVQGHGLGQQTDRIAFSRDAGSDGCSLKIDGTLRESWNDARGKGVVFEFRKLFGRVVFGAPAVPATAPSPHRGT